MKAFILGIDHTTQYQDNAGRLEIIIRSLCDERKVSLIAEEWNTGGYKDHPTVGFNVAGDNSIAWLNIEIGDRVRKRLGILHTLNLRKPAFDAEHLGPIQKIPSHIYFPRADCLREHRWLRKIVRHKHNNSILVLCGNIHVQPFALKLREAGFDIATGSLCEHRWYRDWPYSKCAEVEKGSVDERY